MRKTANEIIDCMAFVDKDVFKDEEAHYYVVECFDGFAIARSIDRKENEPNSLCVRYPKRKYIREHKEIYDSIMKRLNYSKSVKNITLSNIMQTMGEFMFITSI